MTYSTIYRYALALCLFVGIMTPSFPEQSNDEVKVVPPSSTTAINNPGHHIIINALFDYAIVRDKVISPLLYHTIEGGLTLGYEYRAMRHEHRVLIQMMAGTITRPGLQTISGGGNYNDDDEFSLAAQWSFEYSFAITVLRMAQWQLGVGAMIDTTAEVRMYKHLSSMGIGHTSSSNIAPLILATYQPVPQHSLRFRLAMPLMSLVKRPSWNRVDQEIEAQANKSLLALLYESPRVTSVHEWLRLSFEFKHEWELTKLIQLNTGYRSTLLISNIPRFFGMFSNQVSVGVSFRL